MPIDRCSKQIQTCMNNIITRNCRKPKNNQLARNMEIQQKKHTKDEMFFNIGEEEKASLMICLARTRFRSHKFYCHCRNLLILVGHKDHDLKVFFSPHQSDLRPIHVVEPDPVEIHFFHPHWSTLCSLNHHVLLVLIHILDEWNNSSTPRLGQHRFAARDFLDPKAARLGPSGR